MLNRDSNALWEAHIARQRPPVVRRWHGLALALTGALAAAASAFVAGAVPASRRDGLSR
jgi:hypothetical protein